MLDKMFYELTKKGLFAETRDILAIGNVCNIIYKAANKDVKKTMKRQLEKNGMSVQWDKANRVYVIYFNSYFAGCYC